LLSDLKASLTYGFTVVDRKKVLSDVQTEEIERLLIRRCNSYTKRSHILSVEFVFDTQKKPKSENVIYKGSLHVGVRGKDHHVHAEARNIKLLLSNLLKKYEAVIA
jgi:hypothetical protein